MIDPSQASLWLTSFYEKRQQKETELKAKFGPDFAAPSGQLFGLNKAEYGVVEEWLHGLMPEILALQKQSQPASLSTEPYYGAIGGGLTYSFTPTGLGLIISVKEAITGKELNVTAALDWHFFD